MDRRLSKAPLLVCVAVLALAGCGWPEDAPRPGSPKQAESVADQWLAMVQGGVGDRGWTLVHPIAQQRWFGNSQARYQQEVESIDWRDFRWRVLSPARLDGNFRVTIVIEGDEAPARELADGQLIQLFASDDGVRRALITVLIDWSGLAGVL